MSRRPARERPGPWLERRLGLAEALRTRYGQRQVPAVTHWPQLFHRCLGGVSLLLLVLQLGTGLGLLIFYRPDPQQALTSLVSMEQGFWAGWALRRLHAAGGHLLLMAVSLHMLRVVWRGAYKDPRELYWLSGFCLWLACLFMLLSGDLLPWTQAAWSRTAHLTGLLGLAPPGAGALGLAYALHLGLPWLMLLALAAHLAMIRRLGLAEPL